MTGRERERLDAAHDPVTPVLVAAIAAGYLAGLLVSVAAVLLEHSRVGFGDYVLYGNGALIVPAVLVPWALYWGWTWVLGRGGEALEIAAFTAGLYFGVGMIVVLDTLFYPQQLGLGLADAVPGFLLTGTIYVVPVSLLAALAYWLFASGRVALGAATLFGAAFIAALLVIVYWIGLGILAGLTVDVARREPSRRVAVGIALLVLLVFVANLPYFPALFG